MLSVRYTQHTDDLLTIRCNKLMYLLTSSVSCNILLLFFVLIMITNNTDSCLTSADFKNSSEPMFGVNAWIQSSFLCSLKYKTKSLTQIEGQVFYLLV